MNLSCCWHVPEWQLFLTHYSDCFLLISLMKKFNGELAGAGWREVLVSHAIVPHHSCLSAPVLNAALSRGTSGTEQTGTILELWFYNLLEPRDFRDWKCIKINLPTSFFSLVFNWRPRRVSQTDSSDKFHHHIKMKRKMAGFQLQSKSFPKNCWVPSKKK